MAARKGCFRSSGVTFGAPIVCLALYWLHVQPPNQGLSQRERRTYRWRACKATYRSLGDMFLSLPARMLPNDQYLIPQREALPRVIRNRRNEKPRRRALEYCSFVILIVTRPTELWITMKLC